MTQIPFDLHAEPPSEVFSALPVFPLPGVVLMPSALLPLHVFEPRYRALVQAVLEGHRHLGIATLKPGYEAAYHETHGERAPVVFPEIGVGRIVQSEILDDGRSNIVVAHVASARVDTELEVDSPYRVFDVEPVDAGAPVPGRIEAVRALLLQLGTVTPSAGDEAARLAGVQGMAMVHAVARRMFQDADAQRDYLGSSDAARVRSVMDGLATLMASTGAVGEA